MFKQILVSVVVLIALLSPRRSWAWGCTGHEVVALVALDRLPPQTRAALEHVLANEARSYPGRYCSDIDLPAAAHFASWADDYRSQHKETAEWHYWDIPLEKTSAEPGDYCDNGCVVRAIYDQLAIMKDASKSHEQRIEALFFVIHFVGDVHQPLHDEDNEDRGGNCVPIDFLGKHSEPRKQPNGQPSANYSPNLHSIWDTDLVENIGGVSTRDRQKVTAFAELLNRKYARKANSWKKQTDPIQWALESHDSARVIYHSLPTPIAPVHYTRQVADCGENNTSANYAALHEAANTQYIKAERSIVESRLAAAGVRLAAILTQNWPSDWN